MYKSVLECLNQNIITVLFVDYKFKNLPNYQFNYLQRCAIDKFMRKTTIGIGPKTMMEIIVDEFLKLNDGFEDYSIMDMKNNGNFKVPDFKDSIYLKNGHKNYINYILHTPVRKIEDTIYSIPLYANGFTQRYIDTGIFKEEERKMSTVLWFPYKNRLRSKRIHFAVNAVNTDIVEYSIMIIHFYSDDKKIDGYFSFVTDDDKIYDVVYLFDEKKKNTNKYFFTKYQLREIDFVMRENCYYGTLFAEWRRLNPQFFTCSNDSYCYYDDDNNFFIPDFENSLFLKYGKFIYR